MDLNNLWLLILVSAGGVLALALAFVAVKYRALITEKVKNTRLAGILERLGNFAFQVVGELNQTVVDVLKKDGKWNKEEAEKVKQLALDKLKSYLGPEGIKEAMAILGIDNATLLALLGSMIETNVVSEKQAKERLAAAAA
jgi:hypothetical protein